MVEAVTVRKMDDPIYTNNTVKIGKRVIPIGGPRPELRPGEKLIKTTQSICPVCYRLMPALVFERDNKVWIRKVCPEHGETEDVYWGDVELYKKAMKWDILGRGTYHYVDAKAPCPFTCGLCPIHRSHTALANLVITNRCNISCWYCFYYAEKAGYVYEPSLDQIRFMVRQLAKQGKAMVIQITGGEPTIRDDLIDIIKILKEEGVKHIQLNTNGLRFAQPDGADFAKKIREAGVNTIYMSFDGVSPSTNPKNHWEIPYILDAFRKGGLTSVVLVPTMIKTINDHEAGLIIKFAALNMDVIRGVNFQPVSLTGMMRKQERERYRITIPDVIIKIEEQTDGQIHRNSWYPVPCTLTLSRFIEALTNKPQFEMSNHPACGMGTYVYVERKNGQIVRYLPITEFIDIEGFFEYLQEKTDELMKGKNKYVTLTKILFNLKKFVNEEKQPKEFNIWKILYGIFVRHNYEALGEFNYKMLYLGMMHFMDTYNYDVARIMRCDIHYLAPDGRVIPFCTFNVLPDIYRDYIQEQYKIPFEEWVAEKGSLDSMKYKRNIKALQNSELYRKTYEPFLQQTKAA